NNLSWIPPEWGDWSYPDPKAVNEQLKNDFSDEERAKAWEHAAKAVKAYHDELVEQWQKAMDSLLVYAGLFSGVLTAFNIQFFQLLQPAPTDLTLSILQQISTQLNSFSVNPSFINSTQPALSSDRLHLPFRAPASAIWINILWFASLVCSLASASIALIIKQWLYEESKGLSGTSRETARLRQYRLNSLIKWHVGAIVLIPSILLQVTLFLFLSGLLILLWTIHETMAAVITALVGTLFVFVVVVTILPLFASDCCYRSPQALGVHVVAQLLWNRTVMLVVTGLRLVWLAIPPGTCGLLAFFEDIVYACYTHGREIAPFSTWNGAEQTEVARDNGFLDRHIATMAYTTTFATEHLEALHILLSDLPCDQIFSCFSDIHRSWIHLWGRNGDHVERSGKLSGILLRQPFYCALRKLLAIDPNERDRVLGRDWMGLSSGSLLSSYNAAAYLPRSRELLSTLALVSIGDSVLSKKTFGLLYDSFYYNLDTESVPSVVPYDVLRDVMAVARYNVQEHWVASEERDVWHKLLTVRMSLGCTRWVLINNHSLTGEQEAWIRHETRSLLSSLTEKMTTATAPETFWFVFAFRVIEPLTTICREVSRGHEMVPGELLAIQKDWLCDAASSDRWSDKGYLNHSFDDLKKAILEQKHQDQHAVRC
ncbi:hypothetical protein V8D89_002667, partial [Ganoderma adspersum]